MSDLKRFTIRRSLKQQDESGFICAIDCMGVTVLHLNAGTERNEACAELIADALCSLGPERVDKILKAVNAYRFIDGLKEKP